MKQLTTKQSDLLNFIADYQKQYNTRPTFVEMSQKFGVSIAAIQARIEGLTRKKAMSLNNIYVITPDGV